MSDYGLFEADEAAANEPRRQARTAARHLDAAINEVRKGFGRFLMGATGIDEFEDRWHLSKADIRAKVEPHVFPNTGTMRRIQNAMKADWKVAHPYKLAEDRDAPVVDIDNTFSPSSGNLIPEGNFSAYEDSVDQGGPEKVQRDFTPGGDSGSDKREAARLVADIYTDFARSNGMRVASLDTLDRYASTGIHNADYELLQSMILRTAECDESCDDDDEKEDPKASESDSDDDSGDDSEAPDFGGESDSEGDDESDEDGDGDHDDDDHHTEGDDDDYDFGGDDEGGEESGGGQTYTVPEQAPELEPQMLDEIPHDDPQGAAPVPPEVIDSLLGLPEGTIEQLLLEEVQQGQGGGDGYGGPPQGGPEQGGAPQGGGDDFFGGGGGDAEQEPPRVARRRQATDSPSPIPVYGQPLPPTTQPQAANPIPVYGQPKVDPSSAQAGLAVARRFWAARYDIHDEAGDSGSVVGVPHHAVGEAIRSWYGNGPEWNDTHAMIDELQNKLNRGEYTGDHETGLGIRLYPNRGGHVGARRFWAADDEQDSSGSGGDPSGGGQPPQGDPSQGGDPNAMGGMQQPMLPPPGSQAVAPPQPPMPLENQPAEDALLDTANQAIMQMIDRETQEYQQIIDPLSQALQAVQFAQQVEQSEHPLDVTPPQGTVNADPSAAPGGAQNPMQQQARRHTAWGSQDRYDAEDEHDDMLQRENDQRVVEQGRRDGTLDEYTGPTYREFDGYEASRRRQAKVRTALRGAARVIAQRYRLSATGERMLLEAMGRRNYEHVREALSLVPPQVRKPAAIHMGEMFAADNPRFNKDAWMRSVLASTAKERYQDKAYSGPRDKRRDEHGRQDQLDWFAGSDDGTDGPYRGKGADNGGPDPVGINASRGRLPFDRPRLAGETWAPTATTDVFEFPQAGQVTRVSDNNPYNELPKIEGAEPNRKGAARTREAKDIVKKLQNWMAQQQARGLNYGGDVAAEGFLSQHPKAGPRANQIVHQTVGADPHPAAETAAPKVKVPKAVNPVTKRGSFFTRKVPGWRWDDHLSGYLSKEARAFTCSCGEQVAAPSYKTCKCGKIWNVYAIGDSHHLASDTADVYIAREIPVRDNVIMANKKLANLFGDEPDYNSEEAYLREKKRDEEVWGDGSEAPAYVRPPELDRLFPKKHRPNRKRSQRELIAEIDKLADWTIYDDEDPSRQGGPKKPPSTKVPTGDTKWHSRNSDGKYLSPAVFPPKKK